MPLFIAAGVVWWLDQTTKSLVHRRTMGREVSLGPWLRLRSVTTTRLLVDRHGSPVRLVLAWLAAAIAAIVLHQTGLGIQSRTGLIAVGAALGGAAGNITDIVRHRSVRDFIDLGWWPVFNIADIGIVCGLLLAFLFEM